MKWWLIMDTQHMENTTESSIDNISLIDYWILSEYVMQHSFSLTQTGTN